jgi:hypothetical protein
VYDVGQGEWNNDAGATYHECVPLVLATADLHDMNDEFEHNRPDRPGIDPIEAPVECYIRCWYNSLKLNICL